MQIVHPQTLRQHQEHAHVHEGGEPPSNRVADELKRKRGGWPLKAVLVHRAARAQARRGGVVDSYLSGFGYHRLHSNMP
jgi:hypothetical protein